MTVVIIYAESFYAVEKDLKSICGGLFYHLKPLAHNYGGILQLSDFIAPLAASRPNKLAPLGKKLVKSTCCN